MLKILLANGQIPPAEGFTLVQGLVHEPDPAMRSAGLRALLMFNAEFAAPVVSTAVGDPEPGVAQAAKNTLADIDAIRKIDALRNGR